MHTLLPLETIKDFHGVAFNVWSLRRDLSADEARWAEIYLWQVR
jgi:hypothetical protein